ncbi:MAG: MFS transporter [Promethearchaeota archaeon]|jgi:GPH family glycoside/pentoside/hexuronide:cation symporter
MNETIEFTEEVGTRHSRWTFLSNAFGLLCSTLIGAIQGFTLFYYNTVVGLTAFWIAIAMTLFLIYNAVNDPIFGFLIDRNLRFTRKWGRRFPWIVIGIIPWVFSVFLHFSAPNLPKDVDGLLDPYILPAFGYLLLTLILLDTFGTLVNINFKAVQIEKFRTEYERNRFTKYYAPLDIVAIVLGMLLPPLFTDMVPGDSFASYSMMGLILAVIALIFGILSLPGNREDKIMIDRHFSPESVKRMSFIKAFIEAIKTKSFMVWFLFGICNGIWISLVVSNMLYITKFVLQVGGDMFLIIMGLNLLGTLISIPIWLKYIRKINNNKKAIVVAGFMTVAATLPLTFFTGLIDIMIFGFILGLIQGGLNSYIYTIVGPSVVEDVIVRMGKNQKMVLFGISALLGRLVASIDEFIVAVVHDTTGFKAGKETYADLLAAVTAAGGDINLVLIGLRLIQGVIPAIVLLLGVLILWKFFPISQEKLLSNKAKMLELGF